MFLHVFLAVPLNIKNDEEGHPRLFSRFWAHSKAVSRNFKNEEEGHRASFLVFWAQSDTGPSETPVPESVTSW